MNEELINFISTSFLFRDLSSDKADAILSTLNFSISEFKRGDLIFSPHEFEKKIGFVLEGECDVTQSHGDTSVRLRSLTKGDTFGIIAIFSQNAEYPTTILARRTSKVLFLEKATVLSLVKRFPQVALNVITFLAERVGFLNSKISTFSAGTVEAKLASYILASYEQIGSSEIPFNKAKSAQAISVGRASLYRAISALSAEGLIRLDSKKIYIEDLEGLERIKK